MVRLIKGCEEDSLATQQTTFTSVEDEVVGLHPVPEIEASALKAETGSDSLALRIHWVKNQLQRGSTGWQWGSVTSSCISCLPASKGLVVIPRL